ncbi:MAG TPA: cell division protein ZapB [Thermoanaerobaculia bacterium]|nr:cell division protein ZapB [Thermoanaerobaculia bacterium]
MKKKTTEEQMPLAGTEEGQILARLSERVDKAVQVIQELRRERDALKAKLEAVAGQDDEVDRLKSERTEIRNRIETILSSLEGLEE